MRHACLTPCARAPDHACACGTRTFQTPTRMSGHMCCAYAHAYQQPVTAVIIVCIAAGKSAVAAQSCSCRLAALLSRATTATLPPATAMLQHNRSHEAAAAAAAQPKPQARNHPAAATPTSPQLVPTAPAELHCGSERDGSERDRVAMHPDHV